MHSNMHSGNEALWPNARSIPFPPDDFQNYGYLQLYTALCGPDAGDIRYPCGTHPASFQYKFGLNTEQMQP